MLSVLNLSKQIEDGVLTPSMVIDMCREAIAGQESQVGAFVALNVETAKEQANALAGTALRGLPVGVKDIFATSEFPTQYNSSIYKGHRSRADCAVVMEIKRAGGLVLGKTETSEFAFVDPPRTKNPRNLAHTPGGSSSGSAAAVAAGMVPIATGTQTGGSVIRPAAYCGVAAMKPSYGMIPTVGIKAVSPSLDTVGLFCATVPDIAFVLAAITGRDIRIDRTQPAHPSFMIPRPRAWCEATEPMQTAIATATHAAFRAGARTEYIDLPLPIEEARHAHATIMAYEAFRALAWEYDNHRPALGPALGAFLDKARGVTAKEYESAHQLARSARRILDDLLKDQFLLLPSCAGAAPAGYLTTGTAEFNSLWTLMGAPCVNVPGVLDNANMPLGIQVIGKFGSDRPTLEAAAFLEAALGHDASA